MNLRSRVGNKLYLELANTMTADFDQLFDLVSTIDRKTYIQDNPIIVTATSKHSKLSSIPTIQKIVKKSITKKILQAQGNRNQGQDERVVEDQSLPPVEIFVTIDSDRCALLLNTTGESLHKRGYKKATGEAPINEALAA